MKKIFTLLVAVTCFTASFAQNSWSHDQENKRPASHKQSYPNQRWSNDHNQTAENNHYNYKQNGREYNDHGFTDHKFNDRGYNDRERQRQIDQVNRDCDHRIYSYRTDHSISNYERNRRIRQVESERSARINSFGKGAIIGAAAGLILGAILSH